MNRAARAMPRPHLQRGFSLLDEATLRHNLSFVLHEHSASDAVTEMAHACERHARRIARLNLASLPSVPEAAATDDAVDIWLTATLGLPAATVPALSANGATVLFTDVHTGAATTELPFFRAPAQLSLPADTSLRVGVGALILRPGGASTRLITAGPFSWPAERAAAIRALECLIQRYADQWTPAAPLWPAPAETLLGPDEIWPAERGERPSGSMR